MSTKLRRVRNNGDTCGPGFGQDCCARSRCSLDPEQHFPAWRPLLSVSLEPLPLGCSPASHSQLRHQDLAPRTGPGTAPPAGSAARPGHCEGAQWPLLLSRLGTREGAGTLALATPGDLVHGACWQAPGANMPHVALRWGTLTHPRKKVAWTLPPATHAHVLFLQTSRLGSSQWLEKPLMLHNINTPGRR